MPTPKVDEIDASTRARELDSLDGSTGREANLRIRQLDHSRPTVGQRFLMAAFDPFLPLAAIRSGSRSKKHENQNRQPKNAQRFEGRGRDVFHYSWRARLSFGNGENKEYCGHSDARPSQPSAPFAPFFVTRQNERT